MDAKLVNRLLEGASVFACGIITGSALYVSIVEIPSRKKEPVSYQLQNWCQLFPFAAKYLKPLGITINALVGCTMAKTGKKLWIIPCILFGVMTPYNTFWIASTNDTLFAIQNGKTENEAENAEGESVALWGKLHHIRTVFSVIGFIGSIAALASAPTSPGASPG